MDLRQQSSAMCVIMLGGEDTHTWSATEMQKLQKNLWNRQKLGGKRSGNCIAQSSAERNSILIPKIHRRLMVSEPTTTPGESSGLVILTQLLGNTQMWFSCNCLGFEVEL